MKTKIFRIVVLVLGLYPAGLAFMATFMGIAGLHLPLAVLFGSTLVIYGEYVYNTFKLFKGSK